MGSGWKRTHPVVYGSRLKTHASCACLRQELTAIQRYVPWSRALHPRRQGLQDFVISRRLFARVHMFITSRLFEKKEFRSCWCAVQLRMRREYWSARLSTAGGLPSRMMESQLGDRRANPRLSGIEAGEMAYRRGICSCARHPRRQRHIRVARRRPLPRPLASLFENGGTTDVQRARPEGATLAAASRRLVHARPADPRTPRDVVLKLPARTTADGARFGWALRAAVDASSRSIAALCHTH